MVLSFSAISKIELTPFIRLILGSAQNESYNQMDRAIGEVEKNKKKTFKINISIFYIILPTY